MGIVRIIHRGLLMVIVLMFSWDPVWCGCQKLAATHMYCSHLSELPPFSSRKINVLIIRNSTLENIKKNHFNEDSIALQKLVVRNDNIINIEDDSFKMLTKLQELDLSENYLKILKTETFFGLHSLKKLILSNNDINILEKETFSTLTSLQDLKLNSNKIFNLPQDIFKLNSKLTDLDISNNNIELPRSGAFIDSNSLEILHMNNCSLHYLSKDMFYKMSNLKELFINHNGIEILPERWLFVTLNIKYIDISYNNLSNDKNKHCGVLNKDAEIEGIELQNNPLSLDTTSFINVLQMQCTKKISEEKTLSLAKSKTKSSLKQTDPANPYVDENSNFTFTPRVSVITIKQKTLHNLQNNFGGNIYNKPSENVLLSINVLIMYGIIFLIIITSGTLIKYYYSSRKLNENSENGCLVEQRGPDIDGLQSLVTDKSYRDSIK